MAAIIFTNFPENAYKTKEFLAEKGMPFQGKGGVEPDNLHSVKAGSVGDKFILTALEIGLHVESDEGEIYLVGASGAHLQNGLKKLGALYKEVDCNKLIGQVYQDGGHEVTACVASCNTMGYGEKKDLSIEAIRILGTRVGWCPLSGNSL